ERRQTAIREAGRALALDPTLEGAAELVSHMMLEPPRTMPKAVAEELAQVDLVEDRRQIRGIAKFGVSWLMIAPVMWLLGVHDAFYLGALEAVIALNLAGQIAALKNDAWLRRGAPLAVICGVVMTILVARMFSPFFVAPSFTAITVMSFAM